MHPSPPQNGAWWNRYHARLKAIILLRTEASRTVFAGIAVIISGLICAVAIEASDNRLSDYLKTSSGSGESLQDLVLDSVYVHAPAAADALMLSLLALTILMIVVETRTARGRPWSTEGWGRRASTALRRIFWITSMLYLGRALALSVTLLPAPTDNCKPIATFHDGFGTVLATAVLLIVGVTKACSDMIYSGHTMILTTCAIQFRLYPRSRFLSYYGYVHATTGVVFVVLTHLHYTVDVVLALMVTVGAWFAYLLMLDRAIEERHTLVTVGLPLTRHWDAESEGWWWEAMNVRRWLGAGVLARVVGWLDGVDLRWEQVSRNLSLLPKQTRAVFGDKQEPDAGQRSAPASEVDHDWGSTPPDATTLRTDSVLEVRDSNEQV